MSNSQKYGGEFYLLMYYRWDQYWNSVKSSSVYILKRKKWKEWRSKRKIVEGWKIKLYCERLKDLSLNTLLKRLKGDLMPTWKYFHRRKTLSSKDIFNEREKSITSITGWKPQQDNFKVETTVRLINHWNKLWRKALVCLSVGGIIYPNCWGSTLPY